jgi:hypothetical protein
MSPELEILDQLLGGDMPIALLRRLFDDKERFARAIAAMLAVGDLLMLSPDGTEVPRWQRREVLNGSGEAQLSITKAGANRVA